MSNSGVAEARFAKSSAQVAMASVRRESPPAAALLALCSFLAADDIPRRMLLDGAGAAPEDVREAIVDPTALIESVAVLGGYGLIRSRRDSLSLHRTLQSSILDSLARDEQVRLAVAAGRIVSRSLPEHPDGSAHWRWMARLVPHALTAADHLEERHAEPALRAELLDGTARYMIPQGQLNAARELLDRALAASDPEDRIHARVLNHIATIDRELGRFNAAKRGASRALELHRAAQAAGVEGSARAGASAQLSDDPESASSSNSKEGARAATKDLLPDPDVADDLLNLGLIARHKGEFEDAFKHLRQALTMRRALDDGAGEKVAEVYVGFFSAFVAIGQVDDGIDALREAIAAQEAGGGEARDDLENNRQTLSILTERETAVEVAEALLARTEAAHGVQHPRTADVCQLMAAVLRSIDRLDDARTMALRAFEIDRGNYGPNHFRAGVDLVELMKIAAAGGELDVAEQRLQEATAIVLATPDVERATTLRQLDLGTALEVIARSDVSRPLLPRTRARLDESFAEDHEARVLARQYVMRAFQVAGQTLLLERRLGEAGAEYERGLELALLTPDDPLDDADFHIGLALVALLSDDPAAADLRFREAVRCLSEGGSAMPLWPLLKTCSPVHGALGRPDEVERAFAELMDQATKEGTVAQIRAAVSAALPEGWFAKDSVTLLAPDGQANIIASSEPLDPTIDTDQYATRQGDMLRTEFREYDQKSFEKVPIFGGREGYMREFEWSPEDGQRITQIQLYYAEDGRGYTATATTPTRGFEDRALLLRQTLLGLRIAG